MLKRASRVVFEPVTAHVRKIVMWCKRKACKGSGLKSHLRGLSKETFQDHDKLLSLYAILKQNIESWMTRRVSRDGVTYSFMIPFPLSEPDGGLKWVDVLMEF